VNERRDERPEGSWLDEISLVNKIVVVVTLVAIAGYLVFLIADLFF
jgi:hypothetical protein